jgi:hypothetical protein
MSSDQQPTTPPVLGPPLLGHDGLILEGVLVTLGDDGQPHIAPMGPLVRGDMQRLWLRPFRTSTTYANLVRAGAGVFHVTDDVELIAHAAVGQLTPLPRLDRALTPCGPVLADACRWYAFRVESLDDAEERTSMVAKVVEQGGLRDFQGFNRAKHAVIEAAILATRLHLIAPEAIEEDFARLQIIVGKTGALTERRAFDFLLAHVRQGHNRCGGEEAP